MVTGHPSSILFLSFYISTPDLGISTFLRKYIGTTIQSLWYCTAGQRLLSAHLNINTKVILNVSAFLSFKSAWVDGQGRQPATWATLAEVLEDIEMSSLADQIKKLKLEN